MFPCLNKYDRNQHRITRKIWLFILHCGAICMLDSPSQLTRVGVFLRQEFIQLFLRGNCNRTGGLSNFMRFSKEATAAGEESLNGSPPKAIRTSLIQTLHVIMRCFPFRNYPSFTLSACARESLRRTRISCVIVSW